jgi:hypothetical protein
VKVVFPQGLITEWYPQADYQVYLTSQADGSKHRMPPGLIWIDPSMRRLTGALEWKNVKVQPGTMPELPVEKDANHYYSAREVDAAPITVGGQHEKFLFYRGVGHFPVPLSVLVAADGKIVVENRGREPVPRVILFENRGGRLGFRIAGQVQDRVTIDAPSLDGSFPQLRQDLETALVAQGLFPKEAKAMVETWRDSWFEEGSRLIYIVPSASVDAILPLELDPTPVETRRVFVGRIELITPETQRVVDSAIAKSDWSTVHRYARFLTPILQRISTVDPVKASQIQQRYRGSCQ